MSCNHTLKDKITYQQFTYKSYKEEKEKKKEKK